MLEGIVDISFQYRIMCHDILIDATRAFDHIIKEEDQDNESLLPLIKIFCEQVEVLPLPPGDDLSTYEITSRATYHSLTNQALLPGAAPVSQYLRTTFLYRVTIRKSQD
jgi:hypothetical protein